MQPPSQPKCSRSASRNLAAKPAQMQPPSPPKCSRPGRPNGASELAQMQSQSQPKCSHQPKCSRPARSNAAAPAAQMQPPRPLKCSKRALPDAATQPINRNAAAQAAQMQQASPPRCSHPANRSEPCSPAEANAGRRQPQARKRGEEDLTASFGLRPQCRMHSRGPRPDPSRLGKTPWHQPQATRSRRASRSGVDRNDYVGNPTPAQGNSPARPKAVTQPPSQHIAASPAQVNACQCRPQP